MPISEKLGPVSKYRPPKSVRHLKWTIGLYLLKFLLLCTEGGGRWPWLGLWFRSWLWDVYNNSFPEVIPDLLPPWYWWLWWLGWFQRAFLALFHHIFGVWSMIYCLSPFCPYHNIMALGQATSHGESTNGKHSCSCSWFLRLPLSGDQFSTCLMDASAYFSYP